MRDLAGFDFAAQPSIDKGQVRELATGRFIANGEALLLLGPPGVGKTHLAVGIGREAITAGSRSSPRLLEAGVGEPIKRHSVVDHMSTAGSRTS